MKLPCPSCGAEVTFKSSISIFSVCSYCNSSLVRHDINLESLGKMGELPRDLTPFQIGTRGVFEGKQFELLGRLKVGWEQGIWNEWYAMYDDGREGWLAEAQGFYMMSFAVDPKTRLIPRLDGLQAGQTLTGIAPDKSFHVDDIKKIYCLGSEGELPFKALKGRRSITADLSGPNDAFATIEYSMEDGVRLFIGTYQEFNSFQFTFLRELDGW